MTCLVNIPFSNNAVENNSKIGNYMYLYRDVVVSFPNTYCIFNMMKRLYCVVNSFNILFDLYKSITLSQLGYVVIIYTCTYKA